MNTAILTEVLLSLFMLSCLAMAVSSRLYHCIRIVVVQGVLLALLPLFTRHGTGTETLILAGLNLSVKAIALPWLLSFAVRKANVSRELEPLVGYSMSLMIVVVLMGFSFWMGVKLPLPDLTSRIFMSAAFSVMLTGLFIIMARKKALTQAIGFLIFENGVSLFGAGMMLECGMVVELGILLDLFALTFVMGIALQRINAQFEHIDADRLNALGDVAPEKTATAEKEA